MTRDDIIRIYKEANGWSPKGFENTVDELERFAALVAAVEREACVQVADEYANGLERNYSEIIAAAIRARGEK
jgi:hypothetical protein